MEQFKFKPVSFEPIERLSADFKDAKFVQVLIGESKEAFHLLEGTPEGVSLRLYLLEEKYRLFEIINYFSFYVILDFNAGFMTMAAFPREDVIGVQNINNGQDILPLILYTFSIYVNGQISKEGAHFPSQLMGGYIGGEYAINELGYNKNLYVYSEIVVFDKKEYSNFFLEKGRRIQFRDMNYYQQQWEARRPDVFISHDSADKGAVAEPLYHALTAKGLKVWLDKYTLMLGDSLTEKIDEGIKECRYGVLILSKAFLANERWAKRELSSFSVKDAIGDSHKLIPVWHGISEQDIAATGLYWLIDKVGGSTSDIEKLANDIARVVAIA
jgi:hypothetical protein